MQSVPSVNPEDRPFAESDWYDSNVSERSTSQRDQTDGGHGRSVRRSVPPPQDRSGLLALQRSVGNRQVERMVSATAGTPVPVQRLGGLSPEQIKALEEHIGGRSRQQALLAEEGKHGQGMAEGIVQEGAGLGPASGGEPTQADRERISQQIRKLVDFVKFDDSSNLSVLADAAKGGLSDEQMWRVVTVNSEMMSQIKDGLVINKIIPDPTIESVMATGSTYKPEFAESLGGSVANEANYQGLSGSEAVANFGLDYGGYSDTRNGKRAKLEGGKEVAEYGAWGGLSPYVKETSPDQQGRSLTSVENVFYINMKVPAETLKDVRVPLHGNVLAWATRHRENLLLQRRQLSVPWVLERAQRSLAGARSEIEALIDRKLTILDTFLEHAFAPGNMAVSVNLAGEKNPEDPLTNLGITKPSSRLQNRFGTINQEYHFGNARATVPKGSGIWLKGAPKRPGDAVPDVQVAELQDVVGHQHPAWVLLPGARERIDAALAENRAFRTS